jgi:carboxypeptidase Taq
VNKPQAYALLERRFERLNRIEDALAILQWDAAAMMPEGGAQGRADQIATLKTIHHEILAQPETGDLLDQADASSSALGDWQRANLREMRRQWIHGAALPARLVEEFSRACSACETVWRKARPAGDFKLVAPHLARVVALTREVAAAKAERLNAGLYEALMDQFEPDAKESEIDRLFTDLGGFLKSALPDVLERQASKPSPRPLDGPFPIERQRALGVEMMRRLGFDFAHGRLDVSAHPFCGGVPDDVRITTRYDEADFFPAFLGVLHETGHALYELGLPKDWRSQPVGKARGMAAHESQSLLVEMQVCRSQAFLAFAAPLIREAFGKKGEGWEPANLLAHAARVEPGLIRVDADEVTYPAHIILRHRLEKALVEGQMQVEDLPAAWNGGMKELLGLEPASDREGCLQDIHWYDGAIGYFPSYTLGALLAAQLFQAAKQALPGLAHAIAQGDFSLVQGWMGENVHAQGSLHSTGDLVRAATGAPLGTEAFKSHVRERYLS